VMGCRGVRKPRGIHGRPRLRKGLLFWGRSLQSFFRMGKLTRWTCSRGPTGLHPGMIGLSGYSPISDYPYGGPREDSRRPSPRPISPESAVANRPLPASGGPA
jgi:hypothetical protein